MPPNLKDLKFVRIVDPQVFAVIPRYLFENIKEADAEMIDAMYENATNIMTVPIMSEQGVMVGNLPKLNVWIAVLHDDSHQIKGFLWAEFDSIEKCIFIQACSLDAEYQSEDGAAMKKGIDYLRSLPISDDMKNNIKMATNYPKAFEKHGWKRSKKIFMEYSDVESKDTKPDDKN